MLTSLYTRVSVCLGKVEINSGIPIIFRFCWFSFQKKIPERNQELARHEFSWGWKMEISYLHGYLICCYLQLQGFLSIDFWVLQDNDGKPRISCSCTSMLSILGEQSQVSNLWQCASTVCKEIHLLDSGVVLLILPIWLGELTEKNTGNK